MPNNAQRKLGYRDVVFNVKTNTFFQPTPGDNYEPLDITGGGGGSSPVSVSADQVSLPNGTAEFGLTDPPGGLATQADFNAYIYGAVPTLTSELTNDSGFITAADQEPGFSGDYNDLTNKPDVYTKEEADAKFISADVESFIDLAEYEEDDYFALRTSIQTNIARVRS